MLTQPRTWPTRAAIRAVCPAPPCAANRIACLPPCRLPQFLENVLHAPASLAELRTVDEAVVIGAALSLSSSAFVLQAGAMQAPGLHGSCMAAAGCGRVHPCPPL